MDDGVRVSHLMEFIIFYNVNGGKMKNKLFKLALVGSAFVMCCCASFAVEARSSFSISFGGGFAAPVCAPVVPCYPSYVYVPQPPVVVAPPCYGPVVYPAPVRVVPGYRYVAYPPVVQTAGAAFTWRFGR